MAMERPRWQAIALSTLHCGAGCTLADLTGEWFTAVVPISVGGSLIAGSWIFNYLLALVFGFWFQYLAIRSMSSLSAGRALNRAVKADFSRSPHGRRVCTAGWHSSISFSLPQRLCPKAHGPFWFMMQLAMCAGFLLAYPVNGWLIRLGIKKRCKEVLRQNLGKLKIEKQQTGRPQTEKPHIGTKEIVSLFKTCDYAPVESPGTAATN